MDDENPNAAPPVPIETKPRYAPRHHALIPAIAERHLAALKASEWHAICVVGVEKPTPRHLGDETGAKPFFVTVSNTWQDTFTAPIMRFQPYGGYCLWFRLWAPTAAKAKALKRACPNEVGDKILRLRGAFEIQPTTDIDDLQLAFLGLAEKLEIEVLDDEHLLQKLKEATPQ